MKYSGLSLALLFVLSSTRNALANIGRTVIDPPGDSTVEVEKIPLIPITGTADGLHAQHGHTVRGRLMLPLDASEQERADAAVVFHRSPGDFTYHYSLRDGTFEVPFVEEGVYLLDVVAPRWVWPQYKVHVSSEFHDGYKVTPLRTRIPLEPEVLLIPLAIADYKPKKKKFNIMSYVMSPYGIMIGMAVVGMLMSSNMKMDPAEVEKLQEEMKDSPLAFLMGGQPSSTTGGGTSSQQVAAAGAAGATAASRKSTTAGGKKKR